MKVIEEKLNHQDRIIVELKTALFKIQKQCELEGPIAKGVIHGICYKALGGGKQAEKEMSKEIESWISAEDVRFLLSFAPKDTPEDVPKGLSPTLYLTLSHGGDVKLASRIQDIRQLLNDRLNQ